MKTESDELTSALEAESSTALSTGAPARKKCKCGCEGASLELEALAADEPTLPADVDVLLAELDQTVSTSAESEANADAVETIPGAEGGDPVESDLPSPESLLASLEGELGPGELGSGEGAGSVTSLVDVLRRNPGLKVTLSF